MSLFFYDFSLIRFARSMGERLVRRQRVSMEDMDGYDDGDTLRLFSRPGGFQGITTSALSGRQIVSDGEVVRTSGYAAAGDGGGWYWRGRLGVSAGADYDKINSSNGQWQLEREPSYIEARWLGAGLGQGSDWLRIRRAVALVNTTGGVCQLPAGTFDLTGGSAQLLPESNVTIRGTGRATKLRRTDGNSSVVYAQSKSNVVLDSVFIEIDYLQNFIVAVDIRGATDCTIRNCDIEMTDSAASGVVLGDYTLHAIAGQDTGGHHVIDCRFKNLQIKLTAGNGSRMNVISRCRFTTPIDFAISLVSRNSVEYPSPALTDLIIEDCIIDSPGGTGAIYVGGDSELFEVQTVERVHIKNNIIRGSFTSSSAVNRAQILFHLGVVSRDIQIVGNSILNDQGTYEATVGIRVRSTSANCKVDGMLIAQNNIDGCDHAGLYLDFQGKAIQILNNQLRRCRGINVWATYGDLVDVEVAGNKCVNTLLTGIYYAANTGNIRRLRSHHNHCWDVYGDVDPADNSDNVAYKFYAETGKFLTATSEHDEASNETRTDLGYGAWMFGPGTADVHFEGCDHSHLKHGFLRRTIGSGTGELAAGFASGTHNRGSGTVPSARVVIARIADVSTASNGDVKSPCAGRVIGVLGYLGGAITGANSAITTSIEPAAGGGFTTITNGGFTATFSGSARGTRFQAVPTANYNVERGGTLRATTDGASSTAAYLDVAFLIQEDL